MLQVEDNAPYCWDVCILLVHGRAFRSTDHELVCRKSTPSIWAQMRVAEGWRRGVSADTMAPEAAPEGVRQLARSMGLVRAVITQFAATRPQKTARIRNPTCTIVWARERSPFGIALPYFRASLYFTVFWKRRGFRVICNCSRTLFFYYVLPVLTEHCLSFVLETGILQISPCNIFIFLKERFIFLFNSRFSNTAQVA